MRGKRIYNLRIYSSATFESSEISKEIVFAGDTMMYLKENYTLFNMLSVKFSLSDIKGSYRSKIHRRIIGKHYDSYKVGVR